MQINIVKKVTTKGQECLICENFLYYFKKPINRDGSKRFVCGAKDCSSSITMMEDVVIKVNGSKIFDKDLLSYIEQRYGPYIRIRRPKSRQTRRA